MGNAIGFFDSEGNVLGYLKYDNLQSKSEQYYNALNAIVYLEKLCKEIDK